MRTPDDHDDFYGRRSVEADQSFDLDSFSGARFSVREIQSLVGFLRGVGYSNEVRLSLDLIGRRVVHLVDCVDAAHSRQAWVYSGVLSQGSTGQWLLHKDSEGEWALPGEPSENVWIVSQS